ncbi:MAG: DMT family transporter [Pararhodobacter sp.]|nr:DMT family transporter [Pararhodobacter sp.]
MLWVPITLMASALQVARNATQSGLVDRIGTLGATQVRFLFGLPFAVLFLIAAALLVEPVPALNRAALGWVALGSVAQIGATALMLAAMRARGFAAATALIKTEPVMLALIGWAVLGDMLGPWQMAAIVTATLGTLLMTLDPGRRLVPGTVLLALAAGFLFGASAIGFRGAILALPEGSFVIRATTVLVASLAIQTLLLSLWLAVFDRAALTGAFAAWRPSLAAGFLGAAGTQCWFMGFALTAAANVRTLALVEILMARAISGRLFAERTTLREWAGMALIAVGVGALLMLAA